MTAHHETVRLAGEGAFDDPEVLFVHATGFCKEVWRPVANHLDLLRPGTRTLAVDLRGHGDSPTSDAPYRWDAMTDDVLATLGDQRGVVGVGHSCGGAVIARAAAIMPDVFSAIVIIEPIIPPPPYRRENIPLARAAQRRKNSFPSREAAHERFLTGPMSTWSQAALDAYVDHGFTPTNDGVTLKCSSAVEADVFREGHNHDTWDRVIDISIPVAIVSGELSETHTEPVLAALKGRFPNPEMIVVPDTGHFLPMERPDVIAHIVAERLGKV